MAACFRGQTSGLLGAGQPGMMSMNTNRRLTSRGTSASRSSFAPAAPDVRLVDWDRGLVCALTLSAPGYRVRYAARGMDAGHAADTILADEKPVDSYRLWFGTAPPAPDLVLK